MGHSVCVITLIRLILSVRLQFNDITYNFARISLFTVLEPLLGIIIACLPLFRPAIKKATSGYVNKTPLCPRETPPHVLLSSTMARLRLKKEKKMKKTAFHRFDDDSLLFSNLENNNAVNDSETAQHNITTTTTGPRRSSSSGASEYSVIEQDQRGPAPPAAR